MNNHKLYPLIFIAIVIFIVPFIIGNSAMKRSDEILQNIQIRQLGLVKYTINLEQELKKNQADILKSIILGDTDSTKLIHNSFFSLKNRLQELGEFSKTYNDANVDQIVKKLETRMIGYKAIEASIIDAITRRDQVDAQDALEGYNSVSEKFSRDVSDLRALADACLINNVNRVEESNKNASYKIIFSSLSALLLILFTILKLNKITEKFKIQLERANRAEEEQKRLTRALEHYSTSLEEEVKEKTKEIEHRLYHHALTSLPNRNALLEEIKIKELKSVAIFDIDKFQEFNDFFGEEIGNIALKLSAEFLKDHIFNEEIALYHIGSDQFAYVTFKSCRIADGKYIAHLKEIISKFKATEFKHKGSSFRLVLSSGLSFYEGKMIATADIALKEAKKENIDLKVFDQTQDKEVVYKESIEMVEKLLLALNDNRIICYFQPIVPISDQSKPIKYESLVRLQDTDGAIISPYKFLELSKKTRLYNKITYLVLRNTIATINRYKIHCSFNLSVDDIENKETYDMIFRALNSFEYCEYLTIELLETEAVYNYDLIKEFIEKVKKMKVSVAIDDFGSGYSNFSHILNIATDYIKIDSSLISDIDKNPNSKIMVETIVALSKKLDVHTIAEFVSSREIYNVLKEIGVDYAQGYYLSQPRSIDELLHRD